MKNLCRQLTIITANQHYAEATVSCSHVQIGTPLVSDLW
jgi:hypothetical protein